MTDPVIDVHHHIWRVAKVPWLNGPQLPRAAQRAIFFDNAQRVYRL